MCPASAKGARMETMGRCWELVTQGARGHAGAEGPSVANEKARLPNSLTYNKRPVCSVSCKGRLSNIQKRHRMQK
jgi:hypothetical protein